MILRNAFLEPCTPTRKVDDQIMYDITEERHHEVKYFQLSRIYLGENELANWLRFAFLCSYARPRCLDQLLIVRDRPAKLFSVISCSRKGRSNQLFEIAAKCLKDQDLHDEILLVYPSKKWWTFGFSSRRKLTLM